MGALKWIGGEVGRVHWMSDNKEKSFMKSRTSFFDYIIAVYIDC